MLATEWEKCVYETYVVNIRPISGICCYVRSSKLRVFLFKTYSYVRENTDDMFLRIVIDDLLDQLHDKFTVIKKQTEKHEVPEQDVWTSGDIRMFNNVTTTYTNKTVKQSWWMGTYVEVERDILAISKWFMSYVIQKTQNEELKKIFECSLKMLTYEKYDFMDLVETYNIKW